MLVRSADTSAKPKKILGLALAATKFGLVGALATAVHLGVVLLLLLHYSVDVQLANFVAFAVAFFVAFAGHFLWTFAGAASVAKALPRYFIVSVSGFVANAGVLQVLHELMNLRPAIAAALAVPVVPIVAFVASRYWAFR